MPTRAKTAYFCFYAEKSAAVAADNPGISFREIQTLVGKAWHALDTKEKIKYETQAAKDEERYAKEVAALPTAAAATLKLKPVPKSKPKPKRKRTVRK